MSFYFLGIDKMKYIDLLFGVATMLGLWVTLPDLFKSDEGDNNGDK